jgi:hypothetical protein
MKRVAVLRQDRKDPSSTGQNRVSFLMPRDVSSFYKMLRSDFKSV